MSGGASLLADIPPFHHTPHGRTGVTDPLNPSPMRQFNGLAISPAYFSFIYDRI